MKAKCCLCKKFMEDKYGNNARPLKDGVCCSKCNLIKVIPYRLKLIQEVRR